MVSARPDWFLLLVSFCIALCMVLPIAAVLWAFCWLRERREYRRLVKERIMNMTRGSDQ